MVGVSFGEFEHGTRKIVLLPSGRSSQSLVRAWKWLTSANAGLFIITTILFNCADCQMSSLCFIGILGNTKRCLG